MGGLGALGLGFQLREGRGAERGEAVVRLSFVLVWVCFSALSSLLCSYLTFSSGILAGYVPFMHLLVLLDFFSVLNHTCSFEL